MRFIICTTILPPSVELLLSGASPAAGKYIRNMERALVERGHEIVEMSYVAIPGAKEVYSKLGLDDSEIIYKNKTILKSVFQYHRKVLHAVKKDDVVIFYNVVYYDLGLVSKLKRKGVKCLLILADHTGDMRENGSFVRGLLAKLVAKDYRKFEYVIALSERAKRFLSPKAHVEIIEGGIDLNKYKEFQVPADSEITRYMYAGTLSDVTGVDILLDAIKMNNNKKCEFYISGKGPMENAVKEAAQKDDRIKYLGFVSDDEYYHLMQNADVFVNPRNMYMEQNQNNFPSKVLEYLATGRMVVSTKFPGWERFADCFVFCESDAYSLNKAFSLPKSNSLLVFKNNRARAIEYNWSSQAERIEQLVINEVIM